MKNELFESYQQIKQIRLSINDRIKTQQVKDYLELVIKNNFLESQNVQLLLNLQLQARTIIDLKNMISKQQKYIEENDIGSGDFAAEEKSKYFDLILLDADLFLEGPDLELEDQEEDDLIVNNDNYISDFATENKPPLPQPSIAEALVVTQVPVPPHHKP